MSIVILFYVIIIPLIPLITGRYLSIAPLGGPLAIVSLQLFLGVTVKSIYLANSHHLFSTKAWLQRSNDSFEQAIIFMSLFSFLLCLGYWLGTKYERNINLLKAKSKLSFSPVILTKKGSFKLLIIAVAISLFACFLYLKQRGLLGLSLFSLLINANVSKVTQIEGLKNANFGATFGFITQFFFVTQVYLLIFFSNLLIFPKSKLFRTGFISLLILCLFQILITGKRNAILGLIFPLILIAKMSMKQRVGSNTDAKQKKQKVSSKIIILIIPVSIMVFCFITYVRGGFEGNLNFDILFSFDNLLEPVLESTYFTDVNILASIIEKMNSRSVDFMMGKSYMSTIYGFIPRFIWSDKPAISLGIFVKNEIFGLRGTLGGIPPTMPGEAFINFGWLGLIVPFIYGFALRKFEYLTLKASSGRSSIGFYLYTLLIFTLTWSLMQSSFSIIINGAVSSLLLTLLVWKTIVYINSKIKSAKRPFYYQVK